MRCSHKSHLPATVPNKDDLLCLSGLQGFCQWRTVGHCHSWRSSEQGQRQKKQRQKIFVNYGDFQVPCVHKESWRKKNKDGRYSLPTGAEKNHILPAFRDHKKERTPNTSEYSSENTVLVKKRSISCSQQSSACSINCSVMIFLLVTSCLNALK